MNAQKLEQVQKVFANDRFATENGVVIDEVDDGYAKCSLEIQPHHLNAGGTVMGGAIFTLADFAFAVASNWNKPLNVSTTSQITFLEMCIRDSTGTGDCIGRCIRRRQDDPCKYCNKIF